MMVYTKKGEKRMSKKRKTASLLLAGALFFGLPFTGVAKETKKAAPKKPAPKVVQYVALGDSLAAGQTPDGFIDYGYPDYIADNFTKNKSTYKLSDYDNFGIPGYTSEQLKVDLLKSKKIQKEVKEATHITIDIGANDLLAAIKANPTDPTKIAEFIPGVAKNLNEILTQIDKLNSKAKVFVMGYYNPYPYYPAEQQKALLPLLTAFNGQISLAAKNHKDTYVATEKPIASKYQDYFTNPTNIHLSIAGYKVIANEFWKSIVKVK